RWSSLFYFFYLVRYISEGWKEYLPTWFERIIKIIFFKKCNYLMSAVIKSEHLSKKYIISHQQREQYVTLRDVIAKKAKSFFQSQGQLNNASPHHIAKREEFWALNDISFKIDQGDRVGIIGRNG